MDSRLLPVLMVFKLIQYNIQKAYLTILNHKHATRIMLKAWEKLIGTVQQLEGQIF